jgi:succinate dehydrogenase/fumarate reductase cytochrome b subunit
MKKISTISAVIFTSLAMFPLIASAQTGGTVATGIGTLNGLIQLLTTTVVKSLATLLLSLALLAFFWGIVEYIWGKRQGNGDKVKAGNEFMTWGLIALFVMFSVYGIIKLAQNILGMPNVTTIEIPNITFGGGGGGGNDPNANIGSGCVNVAAGTPCNGGAGKCGAGGVCVPNTGGSGCLAGTSCNGGAGTCNASGACIPSPNVSLCAGLNAQDCVDMGCSWSNSDLSCSQ